MGQEGFNGGRLRDKYHINNRGGVKRPPALLSGLKLLFFFSNLSSEDMKNDPDKRRRGRRS